jgi:hypothetical protein
MLDRSSAHFLAPKTASERERVSRLEGSIETMHMDVGEGTPWKANPGQGQCKAMSITEFEQIKVGIRTIIHSLKPLSSRVKLPE